MQGLQGLQTIAQGLHVTAQGFTVAQGLAIGAGLAGAVLVVLWLEYCPADAQGLLRQGGVIA
ncbi:MAG: hypothetical protein Q7V63_04350 [Gammaproteobacteria bacterium]|nr:hypothetical protein [Gammaproteobacteria bacterium]